MGLIVRIIVNAIALIAVAYLVPGVNVTSIGGAIVAAIVLGIVNAVLRPILILLSLPIQILTLGLFTFIINAALFYLVASLHIGLVVHGFVAALIGSIVLSIVSWLLSLVFGRAEAA
jgi:putative membrane protein